MPPRKRSNAYKTAKLAEAQKIGELRAAQKAENKKPIAAKIYELLKPMIQRIDPLEAMAIFGATYLIKQGINWGQIISAQTAADLATGQLPTWLKILLPISNLAPMPPDTPERQQAADFIAEKIKEAMDSPQSEIIEWIISFTLAYVIIKNFSNLDLGAGGIVGIAKALVPIAV